MSDKEIQIRKEIMFHEKENVSVYDQQCDVIKSLETLNFKYNIERTSQYATGTPTWIVNIYK